MSRQPWYKKSGLVGWDNAKKQFDTSFDEEFPVRNVDEYINEKVKEKALNELFGVK
jgi:hypothetical protein